MSVPGGVIVVVLGKGSPSPARIVRAAGARSVVFAFRQGEITESTADLVRTLAPGVEIDPSHPHSTMAALAAHDPVSITAFSESALSQTQTLADALDLPYHSAETVAALTDKSLQRARLATAGVDATRSTAVSSRADLEAALVDPPGPPFVVKPLRGEGSLDTYLVRTKDDLPADLTVGPDRPFLIEEYLVGRNEYPFGDYASVETLTVAGRTHVLGVTGKLALLPPFRETAQFVPSRLGAEEDRIVAELAARALAALGVTRGLAHTEIKLTPSGPRVIEVNGRLGGHIDELYARAFGLDLVALELAVAAGDVLTVDVRRPDRVHYQYLNPAPVDGGTLVAVDGIAEVRSRPGVVAYRSLAVRGAALPRGVATAELDLLTGDAADHEALLSDIDTALARLRFTIAGPDGVARIWRTSRAGLRCHD